MAMHITF